MIRSGGSDNNDPKQTPGNDEYMWHTSQRA